MKRFQNAAAWVACVGAAAVVAACGGGGGGDSFDFRSESADRYVRVDRMGEPALGTALLSRAVNNPIPVDGNGAVVSSGGFNNQRDALNQGNPATDARDFAFMLTQGPQINSLASYHYELGPQLRTLGLTPCSTQTVTPPSGIADVDISGCVAQVAGAVLPDVLTLDPASATSWPNGRTFDDPVVDRLLAAALLKLAGGPHDINTLVGVINPTRDETGTLSPAAFPHMRAAYPPP